MTNIDDKIGFPIYHAPFLKNPTEFTLIESGDNGDTESEIEPFRDDQVHSVGGTYATWVDKVTGERWLYVRPVMLSTDKPDRVTFFAEISSSEGDASQSVICDMYSRVDLLESPN